MAEDRLEQSPRPPVREVTLGEWFRPFQNYNEIPAIHYSQNHLEKDVDILIPGPCFAVFLNWNQDFYLKEKERGDQESKVVVPLPNGEATISSAQLTDFQEEIETRLMHLNFAVKLGRERIKAPPNSLFFVTVRMPSRKEYD